MSTFFSLERPCEEAYLWCIRRKRSKCGLASELTRLHFVVDSSFCILCKMFKEFLDHCCVVCLIHSIPTHITNKLLSWLETPGHRGLQYYKVVQYIQMLKHFWQCTTWADKIVSRHKYSYFYRRETHAWPTYSILQHIFLIQAEFWKPFTTLISLSQ